MARPRGALVAVSALGSWVIRGPWELLGLYGPWGPTGERLQSSSEVRHQLE